MLKKLLKCQIVTSVSHGRLASDGFYYAAEGKFSLANSIFVEALAKSKDNSEKTAKTLFVLGICYIHAGKIEKGYEILLKLKTPEAEKLCHEIERSNVLSFDPERKTKRERGIFYADEKFSGALKKIMSAHNIRPGRFLANELGVSDSTACRFLQGKLQITATNEEKLFRALRALGASDKEIVELKSIAATLKAEKR